MQTDEKCGSSAPKVSVLVVNYNQSRYLCAAVDSVLNQPFENYEVVIVDDGSSDGSLALIHELVARHPAKIRFCHHPNHQNLGISRTYHLGIGAAGGDYVAFIEGDDLWGPDHLSRKVQVLDHHPEIGVVFSRYRILSNGFYGCDMTFRQWILGMFMVPDFPFNNLKHLLQKNNVATFSAFMTRKSLLDRISLTLPRDILFFDWWVLFQLGMRSRFYLDSSSVVHWRHHPCSVLGQQTLGRHKMMLGRYMKEMYDEIGRGIDLLEEPDRARYMRYKSLLPRFVRFYQQPGARHFLDFFGRAPLWALESLASYCVNHWKYSR